jgi:hypothetical protein
MASSYLRTLATEGLADAIARSIDSDTEEGTTSGHRRSRAKGLGALGYTTAP